MTREIDTTKAWYKKAEVAAILGVSTKTIERMVARKDIAVIWPNGKGGQYRVTRDELDRLIAGRGL